jgi:hypothetical protein
MEPREHPLSEHDPTNGRYARKVPALAGAELGPALHGWLTQIVSYCDRDGITWVGCNRLGKAMGRTPRTARWAVDRLVASGWLCVVVPDDPLPLTVGSRRYLFAPFLAVDKWTPLAAEPRPPSRYHRDPLAAGPRPPSRPGRDEQDPQQIDEQDAATPGPTPGGRAYIRDIKAKLRGADVIPLASKRPHSGTGEGVAAV